LGFGPGAKEDSVKNFLAATSALISRVAVVAIVLLAFAAAAGLIGPRDAKSVQDTAKVEVLR
jgi:hypothetical protein